MYVYRIIYLFILFCICKIKGFMVISYKIVFKIRCIKFDLIMKRNVFCGNCDD